MKTSKLGETGVQRGMSLTRRASLPFWAVLLATRAAWGHHVPVSAEVPQWNLFLWAGLGLLVVVEVAFLVAVRRRGDVRAMERAWMLMPVSVLMVLGVVRVSPAFRAPVVLAEAPPDALRIDVEARQWRWTFRYPDGQVRESELRIPAGRAVQLVLTARDVVHSFDVPALGIRQEVIPGRTVTLNLRVPREGRHAIWCSAVCGGPAEEMPGSIAVYALNEYTVFDR